MTSSRDVGDQMRQARRRRDQHRSAVGWVTPRRVGTLILAGACVVGVAAAIPARAERGQLIGEAVGEAVSGITPGLPPLEVLEQLAATTTTAPSPAPVPPVSPAVPTGPHPLTVGSDVPPWAWDGPARLNARGLAAMAMAVGCAPWQAVFATAIALGESTGRTDAVGDTDLVDGTWSYSAGAWQIRGLHAQHGTGGTRDPQALLHNAWRNAVSMWEISDGCVNWRPWTVWRLNRHLQHLPAAVEGVLAVRGVQ